MYEHLCVELQVLIFYKFFDFFFEPQHLDNLSIRKSLVKHTCPDLNQDLREKQNFSPPL